MKIFPMSGDSVSLWNCQLLLFIVWGHVSKKHTGLKLSCSLGKLSLSLVMLVASVFILLIGTLLYELSFGVCLIIVFHLFSFSTSMSSSFDVFLLKRICLSFSPSLTAFIFKPRSKFTFTFFRICCCRSLSRD